MHGQQNIKTDIGRHQSEGPERQDNVLLSGPAAHSAENLAAGCKSYAETF
jgi:hypothetical protein